MNNKIIIPRGFVTLSYTPGMSLRTYDEKKQEFIEELQQAALPILKAINA